MTLDRDLARLGRKLRRISNVELPRANARALNDSGARVRTRSVRGISAETKLKQKAVRKRYYLKRATAKKQTVRLTVYTRDVSAISQFTPARRRKLVPGRGTNRRGVTVAGRQISSAFIAEGKGNLQVFKRRGDRRLPIDSIKFPIQKPAVRITVRVAKRVMKSQYPRILERELKFRINKVASANA
ncbi:MAG: phage tail protein [Pseudomonadaceae bacterium]|nr:phage tail protein [Pseudomonadaceae bacterium]